MKQYLKAVNQVLNKGTRKENRTGVDTISTFNINYKIDVRRGFPLLTTKEVSWKNVLVENMWFISGKQNIDILHKHGCKFWDAWVDEQGNVPSAYGFFWRNFNGFDQIKFILNELKNNPMSRRMVLTAWEPNNACSSKLPPCHYSCVFNVQNNRKGEKELNLHLSQRSADIALGVPYNIAGYAFILYLFAHLTGLKPGYFAHTLIDAHVYTNKPDGSMKEYDHVDGLKDQCFRKPKKLPKLIISEDVKTLEDVEHLIQNASTEELLEKFKLIDYDPYSAINFKVAV